MVRLVDIPHKRSLIFTFSGLWAKIAKLQKKYQTRFLQNISDNLYAANRSFAPIECDFTFVGDGHN